MGIGPAKGLQGIRALAESSQEEWAEATRREVATSTAIDEVIASTCRWSSETSSDAESSHEAPGESELMRAFLLDAMHLVPLPRPWATAEDAAGDVFFVDRAGGRSIWEHPLSDALAELAEIFQQWLPLPRDERCRLAARACTRWEAELQCSFDVWVAVPHESGRMHYCKPETGKISWEHPATTRLPAHFMRVRAVQRLCEGGYFDWLRHHASDDSFCSEVRISCVGKGDHLELALCSAGLGADRGTDSVSSAGKSPAGYEADHTRSGHQCFDMAWEDLVA